MKYMISIILLTAAFAAFAGEMIVQIPLDASAINFDEAGIYTRITGTGMRLTGAEGEPSLPEFTVRIALPTGCAATGIEIVDAEYTSIRGCMTVIPAVAPQPFSVEREVYSVEPDPVIYSLTHFVSPQSGKLRGFERYYGNTSNIRFGMPGKMESGKRNSRSPHKSYDERYLRNQSCSIHSFQEKHPE